MRIIATNEEAKKIAISYICFSNDKSINSEDVKKEIEIINGKSKAKNKKLNRFILAVYDLLNEF